MITKQEFAKIDDRIKVAIQETFENLKQKDLSNYILFLADGDYVKVYENTTMNINPYVIDNRQDRHEDATRLTFFSNFLNNYYSFKSNQQETNDDEQQIYIELMIYSHIWESKPFLKKTHRFAHINNGEDYDWKLEVPDMGKHNFIRSEIRTVFENIGNPIGEIIKNGFHSSLRNAFSHSDYSFDINNKLISLSNYNGQSWELENITFDDWTKRFVYSALLSYYILKFSHVYRTSLIADFGTNKFEIKHPSLSGEVRDMNLIYRKEVDAFNFEH